MANDIILWAQRNRLPPNSNVVGKLAFKEINPASTEPGCIRIFLECAPNTEFHAAKDVAWIWLTAEVWNQRVPPRNFGSVEIAGDQMPTTVVPSSHRIQWNWRLQPENLESIEASRDPAVQTLNFRMDVRGMIQKGSDVLAITGEGHFDIPLSEWESHLMQLGYGVPPSSSNLIGLSAKDHPTWGSAEKRLEAARKHLRAGEQYLAMTACLDQFSALVSKPYMESQWLPALPNDPDQRKKSVASLLAAHCTYLNRVGYHREEHRPDTQDLQPMPVEQWEAELAVASSQSLLALALRLMVKL